MKKVIKLNPYLLIFLLFIPLTPVTSGAVSILSAIVIAFLAFYFYSIAHLIYQKLPAGHDLNLRLFNLNLTFCATFYFLWDVFPTSFSLIYSHPNHFSWSIFLVSPLLFLAGFALFYCTYWLAKCLATIRLGSTISSNSFAAPFFLMWVFPIGLFWILPAIKNICEEEPVADK